MRRGRSSGLRQIAAVCGVLVFVAASSAGAETIGNESVEAFLYGRLTPSKLPPNEQVPVGVRVGARFKTTDVSLPPPRLSRIALSLSPRVTLATDELPVCKQAVLRESSTRRVRAICGEAEVGQGTVTTRVDVGNLLTIQEIGSLLAFNGRYKGRPAILARVTSTRVGTRFRRIHYVVIFRVLRKQGDPRASLLAQVPTIANGPGSIVTFELSLDRRLTSVSCPPATGRGPSSIALARMAFGFDDGGEVAGTLDRECQSSADP